MAKRNPAVPMFLRDRTGKSSRMSARQRLQKVDLPPAALLGMAGDPWKADESRERNLLPRRATGHLRAVAGRVPFSRVELPVRLCPSNSNPFTDTRSASGLADVPSCLDLHPAKAAGVSHCTDSRP